MAGIGYFKSILSLTSIVHDNLYSTELPSYCHYKSLYNPFKRAPIRKKEVASSKYQVGSTTTVDYRTFHHPVGSRLAFLRIVSK